MTMGYFELPEYIDLAQLEKTGKCISMQKADGDNFDVVVKELQGRRLVKLINRHENDYTRQFPEIVAGLGVKKGVRCVLNVEIAYWSVEKQKYDFNAFRSRQGLQSDKDIMRKRLLFPCKAYVFDLIEIDGIKMENNPDYPFSKRYEILKEIVQDNNVTMLLPLRTDLVQHFKEECEAGREGIMVKSLSNIYCDGKTDSIWKCKNWHFSTLKFSGFEDNNAGITLTNENGDRVLVAGKKAELVRATIIQAGYSYEIIRHLQDRTENDRMREPSHWKHLGLEATR